MSAKEFKLATSEEFGEMVANAKSGYASGDKFSQLAAVHAVGHVINTGDVVFLNRVFEVLSKSTRRNSFIAWAEKHAPAVFDTKAKKFGYDKSRADMAFDGNKLLVVKWFGAKKETLASTIDVSEAFDTLVKRVESAASSGKEVSNLDMLAFLKEQIAKYHANLQLDAANESDVEMGVRTGTNG